MQPLQRFYVGSLPEVICCCRFEADRRLIEVYSPAAQLCHGRGSLDCDPVTEAHKTACYRDLTTAGISAAFTSPDFTQRRTSSRKQSGRFFERSIYHGDGSQDIPADTIVVFCSRSRSRTHYSALGSTNNTRKRRGAESRFADRR